MNAASQENAAEFSDTLRSYQVDEVVVTGTRTVKRIIDIPYSVQRIDNTQFQFERKVSVSDILRTVPGLFLQSRYGNHDVRISIRGFGSRSNSGIRGVRILLDGIPESEPDGQTRIEAIDFNSIGRIEIVKGNSSSLYTNAPGGVINFINDIDFMRSFAVNFNQFGSFDLRQNGFKTGIRTAHYGFLTTYNYHQAKGYRPHSEDFWHIVNTVLETSPGTNSRLRIFGYYVDGLIRLPGSLTRAQYDADPFQASARDVARDSKRITKKGRIGLQFHTFLGEEKRNEVELTGYGTIKYFERTAADYRIINRDGIGVSGRYVFHTELFGLPNQFSVGGDALYQSGPIESYQNINGKKGDNLEAVTDETIANTGFYFQNSLTVIRNTLDFLFTGRYDKVVFDQKNSIFEVQNAIRRFEGFTPKAALNYKVAPTVAVYTSYGLSFDSPAGNELDNYPTSSKPTIMLNPDLNAQKSRNFELGCKGNIVRQGERWLQTMYCEVTFFNSMIEDEIVPFEVFGEQFFRNAARTNRTGIEVGVDIEILPGLKFIGAYTFSHFTYDAYTTRSITLDNDGNFVALDGDFAGNIVPSIPKHNTSLTVQYTRSLAEALVGFLKVNYNGVTGLYVDDANSEKSKGYQLFNTAVGFDLTIGRFNLLFSGGVNNLANKTHVAFININSASKQFYEAGEPRHFFGGLNMGYTFQ